MKAKINKHTQSELASLAIQIMQGSTTIQEVVAKYKIPYWQVAEVLVSLVQNSYKIVSPNPQVDLSKLSKNYGSLNKPVCFLHIMKTAGTSLTTYLKDFYSTEDICTVGSTAELEKLATRDNLRQYGLITGHIKLSWMLANGFDYEDFNYITFLRHPLSRQLSFYQHCMRAPESFQYEDFIQWNPNNQCLSLSPLKMRSGYATMKEHLEAAKEALERLFFVGVQENFDECLYSLSCLLGQPLEYEPNANRVLKLNTKSESQKDEFPQKIVDEIVANNWADVELHAYATDLFGRKFSKQAVLDSSNRKFHEIQPLNIIKYTMDQPLIGSGWHYREGTQSEGHGIWRWTGPGTESRIKFNVNPTRAYRLTVKVVNLLSAIMLDNLALYVNDQPIEFERDYSELGVVRIHASIANSLINKINPYNLCLKIVLPKTIKFNEVDTASNDDRLCGIAVTNIDLIAIID